MIGRATKAAARYGLAVVGALDSSAGPEAMVPDGVSVLVLLGPGGPQMWTVFSTSPEALDGAADALDRWSARVIGDLAEALDAQAFFPFGGPPWSPFQRWAAAGEGAVVSPVSMQASPSRGLWASYRGALGFADPFTVPAPGASPCMDCPAPCQTACPVDAFADGTYDTAACVAHVDGAGTACRDGCLVRRVCPAGAALDLPLEQRRFHMSAFLKAQRG